MLQDNYAHEGEAVKLYNGRMLTTIPKMKEEGRVPISVAWLMMRQLLTLDKKKRWFLFNVVTFPQEGQAKDVAETYWETSINCVADGIIAHPEGKAKIVLDSEDLKDLTPKSSKFQKYSYGEDYGLVLKDADIYETARGSHIVEVTVDEVARYTGLKSLKAQTLDNKIWRILARHPDEVPAEIARDKNLLKEYANAVFSLDRNSSYHMGINFNIPRSPMLFTWRLNMMGRYKSSANYMGFGTDCTGTLGVLPEALESTVDRSIARVK